MTWARECADSQPTQHSEGQRVTSEHGTATTNVFHADINAALAKI